MTLAVIVFMFNTLGKNSAHLCTIEWGLRIHRLESVSGSFHEDSAYFLKRPLFLRYK